MNAAHIGNLIVLAPLAVALIMVAVKGYKTSKVRPFGADEKDVLKEVGKSAVYVVVAMLLVRWLALPFGTTSTIIGTIITSIFALLVILAVVDLPTSMNSLHNLAWRDGWKTPVYSRTRQPVEYVRWGRRFAMLTFVLFMVMAALAFALTGPSEPATATDNDRDNRPAATAPAAPATTSTPAAPAPATTAPSGSPANTIVNNCGGPTPVAVEPTTIKFGTQNLQVCYNGSWQNWPANVVAPTTVKLTAWAKDGTYGYGVAVVGNDSYLFRTTEFK